MPVVPMSAIAQTVNRGPTMIGSGRLTRSMKWPKTGRRSEPETARSAQGSRPWREKGPAAQSEGATGARGKRRNRRLQGVPGREAGCISMLLMKCSLAQERITSLVFFYCQCLCSSKASFRKAVLTGYLRTKPRRRRPGLATEAIFCYIKQERSNPVGFTTPEILEP